MTPNVAKYFDYYGLADKHADKFERWFRIALKKSSVYDIFFYLRHMLYAFCLQLGICNFLVYRIKRFISVFYN